MAEIREHNGYIDFQDEHGNVDRVLPKTTYENITDIPDASSEQSAPVRLHDTVGDDIHGAFTQKYSTEKFRELLNIHTEATEHEKAALLLLAANAFVIDDTNGKTYKISSSDGQLYFDETDVSVLDIVNLIKTASDIVTDLIDNTTDDDTETPSEDDNITDTGETEEETPETDESTEETPSETE